MGEKDNLQNFGGYIIAPKKNTKLKYKVSNRVAKTVPCGTP